MKQATVQFSFDEEKHVPIRVREYISKKNLSDPNKSSSNGNRK